MPEYPDIIVYIERLSALLIGRRLEHVRIANPFVLRTADPLLSSVEGEKVIDIERRGKRVVFCYENDLFLILHLMIAGRLQWRENVVKMPGKIGLAAFDFENGTLLLTEAGTKKRASIHLLRGRAALENINPGGLEVFNITTGDFKARLISENHTLKRALTDPRLFSGIGNAYSDEILHRAKLSPVALTQKLSDTQIEALFAAVKSSLTEWTDRLRKEAGDALPRKVTAFRKDMAVHGKFGKACPACGTKVQRIRYANNETNYCPRCQTNGKLLADRALSRLLKSDWPRSVEEMEDRKK